ncbi:Protein of unknown function DUF1442 [Macleaya cordata]|uniref:S-adenosyl-L-methionine-dependent methyltransferase n=1 Tax=Macleaya cordata TaxID=56857 RepID=A0A200QWY8_MACCD|nr:Protein of unknown function DUF1442 [Macleaya cordata]
MPSLHCKDHDHKLHDSASTPEPECTEFISALAAGMSSQLIVEVSSEVSHSTIALAAAARQTGGRLVCILPEENTSSIESKQVIKESGLKDMVEFKVGDPFELLQNYENIDFFLIDCKTEEYTRLLKLVDVNPRRAVVVANNLEEGRKGLGGNIRSAKDKSTSVRSMKHPIGKGMEVTMIGKSNEFERRDLACGGGGRRGGGFGGGGGTTDRFGGGGAGGGGGGTPPIDIRRRGRRSGKSKWVVQYDEESGEEHIFRVPSSV